MDEIFEFIKTPLSKHLANAMGIEYHEFRKRKVATINGQKAVGANNKKPFEAQELSQAFEKLTQQFKELTKSMYGLSMSDEEADKVLDRIEEESDKPINLSENNTDQK